jgi:small subunit ribosomal protein S2
VIPGNDDAIRSIKLYVRGVADAIIDGRERAQAVLGGKAEETDESGGRKPVRRRVAMRPKGRGTDDTGELEAAEDAAVDAGAGAGAEG